MSRSMLVTMEIEMIFFFFLNQQFITWRAVADHGSYFVTTYRRHRLHVEEKTEEGKRYIEEREKKN